MSSCERFQKLIQSTMNGQLDPAHQKELDAHLAQCEECSEYLARTISLSNILKTGSNKQPEVSQRVKSSLHLKLVEAAQQKQKAKPSMLEAIISVLNRRAVFVPALAVCIIAAVLFIKAVMISENSGDKIGGELVSQSEVPEGRPVTITIEYIAARDIPEARFTVALDKGLSFYSDYAAVNAIKNRSWNGSLKKGVNTIPFVVKVAGNGTHTINTRADFEGRSHSHKIVLNAGEGKVVVSYFKLPDKALSDGAI